jgi:DNA-binding MurR/RpiR family transcriptional regulator
MTKSSRPSSQRNLTESVERLSIKRQEIIRPILEHPREYVLLSVRAMAKRLNTDPATIVRIVQGLGFGSYREFQKHLHELSLAFATSLDTMLSTDGDADKPTHVRASIEQDIKNLQGLKNTLDSRRLLDLAKRLYSARRIVLFAGDLATHLADYLEYQLSILGLPVFSATSAGRISHMVRTSSKKDLILAISFRRGLRQTVEGAEQVRERGAYCVGITNTYLSPLARLCDEVFLVSIESTSFGASYTAPIALANAILAACGEYRRPETIAMVKEMAEEQRRGFRWYTP